ncbi:hypothetical protein [Chlorogloeopsis sp. ULAP02]
MCSRFSLSGVSPCPISLRPRVFLSPRPLPNPQSLNKISQTLKQLLEN